jgi:hypothetical protein
MNLGHLLPLTLLIIPLLWGLYGWLRTRYQRGHSSAPHNRSSAWPLVINSAVLYALAFNIIFFIQELFLALGKRWLGLKAYLYHNNHNWEGSHPMERLAQGYGAAAIFITGVICLLIARRMKLSTHWKQLFFLWMAFQGFAQSLPQFITAPWAADTDTGQAYAYLGINYGVGIAVAIACIILMLLIGASYSKYLLQLAPDTGYTDRASKRFGYTFRIAILASLIGIVLIIPFRIMPWDRALAPLFVTLASIPMVFAHAWRVKPVRTINSDVNRKVFITPFIILVLLLLVFQLILAKGVAV